MKVRIKAPAPLWLHLLATCIFGAAWLGIVLGNVFFDDMRAHPLDSKFPETVTGILTGSLLPRFTATAAETDDEA